MNLPPRIVLTGRVGIERGWFGRLVPVVEEAVLPGAAPSPMPRRAHGGTDEQYAAYLEREAEALAEDLERAPKRWRRMRRDDIGRPVFVVRIGL